MGTKTVSHFLMTEIYIRKFSGKDKCRMGFLGSGILTREQSHRKYIYLILKRS
jgi:hypothetical protein